MGKWLWSQLLDATRTMPELEVQPSVAEEERQLILSQMLAGIDWAARSGERALKGVGADFRDLFVQLHEVFHGRELWMHRFLGTRDLQYASELCGRVARTCLEGVGLGVFRGWPCCGNYMSSRTC